MKKLGGMWLSDCEKAESAPQIDSLTDHEFRSVRCTDVSIPIAILSISILVSVPIVS